jgi:hypothetical protein
MDEEKSNPNNSYSNIFGYCSIVEQIVNLREIKKIITEDIERNEIL